MRLVFRVLRSNMSEVAQAAIENRRCLFSGDVKGERGMSKKSSPLKNAPRELDLQFCADAARRGFYRRGRRFLMNFSPLTCNVSGGQTQLVDFWLI
jgi:hypothetical protein